MSIDAKETADRISWDNIAQNTLEIYKKVIKKLFQSDILI
jgi:hypothetical protein